MRWYNISEFEQSSDTICLYLKKATGLSKKCRLYGQGWKPRDELEGDGIIQLRGDSGLDQGLALWWCSVTQPCLTLWDSTDCSTPGFPFLHHLSDLVGLALSDEKYLDFGHILKLQFFPEIWPRVRLLDHMVTLFVVFLRSFHAVFHRDCTNSVENSLFCTFSPASIIFRHFADGHSDWCEVVTSL